MATNCVSLRALLILTLFVIGSVHAASIRCMPIFCIADPCLEAKCTNHPSAVCRSNYCAGCIAVFYDDGQKVTDCTDGGDIKSQD